MSGRPLAGVRVVEAASMVLVPSAAAMLADFGAEVVKVEPPEGDENRRLHLLPGMPESEHAFSFLVDNRGKQGVVLDLKQPEGRGVLDRLLARADVFMTNYRPAALARLGLAWEDVAAKYPRLVYASATGFGEEGREANRPAYDTVVYWTRSGLETSLFPTDGWLGPIPGGSGDHPSGAALFGAVMLALFARERSGRGGKVSTSLLANGLWANAMMLQAALCGATLKPKRARHESESFGSVYYRTSDRRLLKFSLVNPERVWPRFCAAAGRPDLVADPRFATVALRREHAQALIGILDEILGARDADHWHGRFEAHDVPFAIVPTYPEIVADPQADAIGAFVAPRGADGAPRVVNNPLRLAGAAPPDATPAPALGEHTESVLAGLGYDAAEVRDLLARGAVGAGRR